MIGEATRLKPCPFCGSTNINDENARDFISCRGCGVEGPFRMGQGSEASIAAWNRRATSEAQAPADGVRDAARYRWLRDESVWRDHPDGRGEMLWAVVGTKHADCTPIDGSDLDDAIDERLAVCADRSMATPKEPT